MVKPLHPLDEIADRISQADGGVRLTRDAADAAGGSRNELVVAIDPVTAIMQALASPLEYPPLAAGIVPGDRVAIAVDGATPCIASIVRGAFLALMNVGVESADISTVTTDEQTVEQCREALAGIEPAPHFVVHDPADEKSLCMVGATKRGQPLLVNRTIFEADLVLPIGCARLDSNNAYDSLFPRFSDAETIDRYRTPAQHDAIVHYKGKRSEADEAGWMIGAPMTVQVVPGPGEEVLHVVAGEPQAVARRCEQLCKEHWSLRCPQRVSLLVATVTGGAPSQTWANVGRALANAENVLEEGGAVAICSNLEEPPGHSLGRLIGGADLDVVVRKISHDHDADTWPAWRLGRALQRGPVYFLSQLDADTVEDLGLAPVESVDDLVRLAGRQDSFVVVEDAQHAVVTLGDEAESD